ncbi:MAG: hypothetical protein HRU70_03090 [Phycisphaeraceae bacterium]|nr:MAG: hypothetical protein HRU70_03090 [Phycisphaeraceae bacterium]
MAPAPHHLQARRALPVAVVALVLFALLPLRATYWVEWFKPLVLIPTGPISGVFRSVVRLALPASPPPPSEEVEALTNQARHFEWLYLRERAENDKLRGDIVELQRGAELIPDLPVALRLAPVIGASAELSSGLLTVRGGAGHGIDTNTVAATTGLQLVGRVVGVSGPTARVRVITRPGSPKLDTRVMTASGEPGPRALLEPSGDGTLRGVVEYVQTPGGGVVEPAVGQVVRLDDPGWPAASRMLIVGRVVSVEPAPEHPLRRLIVVEPTVRIERVAEVVLRSTLPEPEGSARGGGR